jgi:aryl sulfotransferase
MSVELIQPEKTRDIQNHHMDSTLWDKFEFRDDDIVIGTWAKSGTTWMQQIVAQLIYEGNPEIPSQLLSPWLEFRVLDREMIDAELAQQTQRRFIKTHLPVDALVFSEKAKYLYIGRDFPDVVWSLYNHLYYAVDEFYEMVNDTPGRVGPPLERPGENIYEFWQQLLRNDCHPIWSFWENVRTWWEVRQLPNVMLLHFNDLKKELPGEIRRIAEFLEIPIDESKWDAIVEHCSFDWMKENAVKITPMAEDMWEGGARTFIHKGTNKRWVDVLSDADIEEYQQIATTELGSECLHWLQHGSQSNL